MPYVGPTEIHVNGQDWVRDGGWFVKKALADQYGINDDRAQVGRISYADGVNTQATERQRAADMANTTSTGFNSEQERQLRAQWERELGVNRKSDENQDDPTFVAKQVLADEIAGGHFDKLSNGVYFSFSNGAWRFKDANGREFVGDPSLQQQAMEAQKQKDLRYGGGGGGDVKPPVGAGPQAPAQGGQPATKQVNGVWYTQQPDGTWVKQDKPSPGLAPGPPQPGGDLGPPAQPPQLSTMVGNQQATLENMKMQPQDFWKGAGGGQGPQAPKQEGLTAPPKMPSLQPPSLSGGIKQPPQGGGLMKQPAMPRMGKLGSFTIK